MGSKQAATYHGADIVTRLRAYGPESDYDGVMQEAADKIEEWKARYEFFRDRYSEAIRKINQEADLHEHCDVTQASDE